MAGIKNFQVSRNKNTKNSNMFNRGKNQRKEETKSERMMNGIAAWASWYRFRMDRFAEEYLGFRLKMFQVFLLFAMQHNHYFMYLASRGQGKSYISAIYACCRCILYPGTLIVIASGTKGQAKSVLKKIENEMSGKPNLAREIADIRTGANDSYCIFHNGSRIDVVTSNDNARSARAHVIIVDEFRMVDFQVITKVLRKFLSTPRQAPFMELPGYEEYEPERNKEIYLSSAWFKSHWSWERAKTYFDAMMKGQQYFLCALPYQVPVKERLLMKNQVLDEMSENDFDNISWKMEMEALWHGESDKAFFNFEDLSKTRKEKRAMYPPEIADLIRDKKINSAKTKGEIRFLGMDIATSRKTNSDSTALFLGIMTPTKTGYEVTVPYAESMDGALVPEQALRFNRLKHYFDVDYGIIDTWNAGIGVYDLLAQGMDDTEWDVKYDPLSCMNDPSMADRCPYPNAEKAIYSMRAGAKDNSDIAYLTKNLTKNNKVRLLIHEKEAEDYLEKLDGYKSLDDTLKAKFKVPYIQATLLINEMINLEAEYNDTKQVKLKEPRSGRKDKYSSFSYMLHLIDHMHQKNRKNKQGDFDAADMFMINSGRNESYAPVRQKNYFF